MSTDFTGFTGCGVRVRMWDPDAAEWACMDPYEQRSRLDWIPELDGWDDPAEAVGVLAATVIEDARLEGGPWVETESADLHYLYGSVGDPFEVEGRAA